MDTITVTFEYRTGFAGALFRNARLTGSWTPEGRHSDTWAVVPMKEITADDGCAAFVAEVPLAAEDAGKVFSWGVMVDAPGRIDLWGIPTESGPLDGAEPLTRRAFTLDAASARQRYCLSPSRDLGVIKVYREGAAKPGISFAVWAPHAKNVELVTARSDSGGYIWDDGRGIQDVHGMTRDPDGVWRSDPANPAMADYDSWRHVEYMYRVTREDGSVAYRTDIFSRAQAGSGGTNPEKEKWSGRKTDLESVRSCSVVVDPDALQENDEEGGSTDGEAFWRHEFDPLRPVPSRLEDMVIYEMHVAGLGAGKDRPGNLEDAIAMLGYLEDLGINAVELLPMSQFEGVAGWGYGTSHYYAIKYGREAFRRFVRACHRHGMAVIVDVVYNHYTPESERVQWMYDSDRHDHNFWYYYVGSQDDYPDFPEGGYCDNMSTGYLPNMREERVRAMMIGSAVSMALEFHVDGFRMDLTQALHSFNVLHKDGSHVAEANEAGIRFMREWARTLRLVKPGLVLLAEDHSGWNKVARRTMVGGLGFDATWWSEWYHQLVGDADKDAAKAHLLRNAGYGTTRPLKMNAFAAMVFGSPGRVVYHSSHDESGNSDGSARDILVAVNGMLFDNTRFWAEARCRVAAALTLFSAGTPMFFMGEEVCAREPYRHGDFLEHREDVGALREGEGAAMFRFYRDSIRMRLTTPALQSPCVDIIKVHNRDRIIAFRRWRGDSEFLVVASFNDNAFKDGYAINHKFLKGKKWVEVLNSDAATYGGGGLLNPGELDSEAGMLSVRLPACAVTVLARSN